MNKYSSTGKLGVFKLGNVTTAQFAYLNYSFTESVVAIASLIFPNLLASSSVEVAGFTATLAWVVSNDCLFGWFCNSTGRLDSAGYAEAMRNHWRIPNPCILLRDVLEILKGYHNVNNLQVNGTSEVSKCFSVAFSKSDKSKQDTEEIANMKSLSGLQLVGVFTMTLVCLGGAFSFFHFACIITAEEHREGCSKTIKLISIKNTSKESRNSHVLVVLLYTVPTRKVGRYLLYLPTVGGGFRFRERYENVG